MTPMLPRLSALALLIGGAAHASHEIAISPEQMKRLGINVALVETADAFVTDRLPARVAIPPQQARIVAAPRGGLVTALDAAVGDEVQAGQVLAHIESPELVGLQRELLQASTQLRLAETELKRDQQLFKEGIIAERRYLETRSRHDEAAALVEERRQVLQLAGVAPEEVAALERSRTMTSTLEVRSPIAGVVVETQAALGERVSDSQPLYRVAQMEPLWLEINAPLNRLKGIQPGGAVEIPCERGEARVALVGRNVDPTNQTVMVRAEVKDSSPCLRPGQFVEVRLRLSSTKREFRVPSGAVTRIGDTTLVFVHEAAGFFSVPVEVSAREGEFSVVTGELSAGEEVATSGIAALKAAWSGREEAK
jgi:cobalt-zinc-cadmium efflux system membrane fusion protein